MSTCRERDGEGWKHLDHVDLGRASAVVRVEAVAGRAVARRDALPVALVGLARVVAVDRRVDALVEDPRPQPLGRGGERGAAEVAHQPKGGPQPRLRRVARHLGGDLGDTLGEAELVPPLASARGEGGGGISTYREGQKHLDGTLEGCKHLQHRRLQVARLGRAVAVEGRVRRVVRRLRIAPRQLGDIDESERVLRPRQSHTGKARPHTHLIQVSTDCGSDKTIN